MYHPPLTVCCVPVLTVIYCCRYDGRGHLYDLSGYDADVVKGAPPELSEEEQNLEKLCDEERYLELHTNVVEKAMYEGESANLI